MAYKLTKLIGCIYNEYKLSLSYKALTTAQPILLCTASVQPLVLLNLLSSFLDHLHLLL